MGSKDVCEKHTLMDQISAYIKGLCVFCAIGEAQEHIKDLEKKLDEATNK
jgi:hypothetical protein